MTPDPPRTMTSRQVAAVMHVSQPTVGRYARAGMIPFSLTPGGQRRYNLAEVRAALGGQSLQPAIDPDVLLADLRELTKAVAHLAARIDLYAKQSRKEEV